MKIAIVGAGAIGGLLGTRLSLAGEDVAFIARNRNLLAIEQQRLSPDRGGRPRAARRACARTPTARSRPAGRGAARRQGASGEGRAAGDAGLLGPETAVVTMINGLPWWYFQQAWPGPTRGRPLESVDPGGAIAAAIDPERVIGSVVYPAAELVEPGKVRLIEGNRFTLGEPDGARSPRIEALSQALVRAGFKAPVTKDIRAEIWLKLWGNLSFNPVSALSHATLEGICRDPDGRAVVEAMMREAQAVAEKLGVVFKISIDKRIAGAEAVGAHKTSMLQDVEHGRAARARGAGRQRGRAGPDHRRGHAHHRCGLRTSPPCSRAPWWRAAPAWRSPAECYRRGRVQAAEHLALEVDDQAFADLGAHRLPELRLGVDLGDERARDAMRAFDCAVGRAHPRRARSPRRPPRPGATRAGPGPASRCRCAAPSPWRAPASGRRCRPAGRSASRPAPPSRNHPQPELGP